MNDILNLWLDAAIEDESIQQNEQSIVFGTDLHKGQWSFS